MGGAIHVLQMVEPHDGEEAAPTTIVAVTVADTEEISPLLPEAQGGGKMSIFSVSGSNTRRRLPKVVFYDLGCVQWYVCPWGPFLYNFLRHSGCKLK